MSGVASIVNSALVAADAADQARRRAAALVRANAMSTATAANSDPTVQNNQQIQQGAFDLAQSSYLAAVQRSEVLRQQDVAAAQALARSDTGVVNSEAAALFSQFNGT